MLVQSVENATFSCVILVPTQVGSALDGITSGPAGSSPRLWLTEAVFLTVRQGRL